jgi:uncharacterized protein (UPF0548 family)
VPVVATRPSDELLSRLLVDLRDQDLTYREIGATALGVLPEGYHHERVSTVVGRGPEVWASAQEALRTWQAHRRARATVTPADAPLLPGTVVVASVRVGPVYVVAPCRVVYSSLETDRFGFAYGTLPGHPEQGEEAFHVARDAAGVVTFEIVAFSRAATILVRLGGPVARMVQRRTTQRYLEGVRAFVAAKA